MKRINYTRDKNYIIKQQEDIKTMIKENSKQIGDEVYLVDKELFLNNLIIHGVDEGMDPIYFSSYFSNKRINNVFISKCIKFSYQIDAGEIFGEFLYYIVNYLKKQDDYIKINYKEGLRGDDLSKLIFQLDVRMTRKLLVKYLDKSYNPNRKEREKYIDKYGSDIIRLDDYHEDPQGKRSKTPIHELISEGEAITQVSNKEVNYQRIERIKDKAELTERQRELCDVLLISKTQKEASELMGITEKSVQRMVKRIRKNVENNIDLIEKEKGDIMYELEEILSRDFEENELMLFIKYNINDDFIQNLVYKIDKDIRKPFIRYIKNKKITDKERDIFLKSFLQLYYEK